MRGSALLLAALAGLAVAVGCSSGRQEVARAGHVEATVHVRCNSVACPQGIGRTLTLRALRVDGEGAASFRIRRRGLSAGGALPAGRWRFSVPRLERPGCRPRITVRIRAQRASRIAFSFSRPPGCWAVQRPIP